MVIWDFNAASQHCWEKTCCSKKYICDIPSSDNYGDLAAAEEIWYQKQNTRKLMLDNYAHVDIVSC